MLLRLKNKEYLIVDEFKFKCSIGKKGLNLKKIEGDHCTPIGVFKIGKVYYRPDRIKKPDTSLKTKKITKNMGWCDDPYNKNYNKEIILNKKNKGEKLFRKDNTYDILIIIEIKDYFNYEINYFTEKKDLIKKINEDRKFLENSIIIVNQKDFSSLKNKTNEKQIHCITKFPIKISNLIDQLNVRFIQQNYSAQSNINISKYILDINSRILKKYDNELKLTEREIDTIIFLKNKDKPVKVDVLQKKVWKYAEDLETHTVETHIYRLRKKIKDTFNDDSFIESKKDGYIINE